MAFQKKNINAWISISLSFSDSPLMVLRGLYRVFQGRVNTP